MYPNKDFTFVQDSAPSHRANQMQNFLKWKLKSRFVRNTDWPDCNLLDYYFWDRVQEKVYDGRYWYPFARIAELKRRIRGVWMSNEAFSLMFGSRWRKRRHLNQNCYWIDINEQIYLLNTLWLFSFYEIIVSQFSCHQIKLDRKRKFEIIFWRQNFQLSRV